MKLPISDRLLACCAFVNPGDRIADVGCDHGYLSIHLLTNGIASSAIASDLREGPLQSARDNAAKFGVREKIEFCLTDGASALAGRGITDVAVCGMGGELISRIIEDAAWLKCEGIRLILQPMTRPAHLRRTLARLGFFTVAEDYSSADGKLYVCICAEYNGHPREISDTEAEIGAIYSENDNNNLQINYLEAKKRALLRAAEGKRLGGQNPSAEETLIAAIDERIGAISGASV